MIVIDQAVENFQESLEETETYHSIENFLHLGETGPILTFIEEDWVKARHIHWKQMLRDFPWPAIKATEWTAPKLKT